MTDLKKILMELGNKLVLEHKFDPAQTRNDLFVGRGFPEELRLFNRHTRVISVLTQWINQNPEAQVVLKELGFDWSMSHGS